MKVVLDYLAEYGEMGEETLKELLNMKRTCTYLVAHQMMERGLIESSSSSRGAAKRYRLA